MTNDALPSKVIGTIIFISAIALGVIYTQNDGLKLSEIDVNDPAAGKSIC